MRKNLLVSVALAAVLAAAPLSGVTFADEVTEITYTSWRTEDQEGVDQLIAEFEQDYPNIKVTFSPVKDTEYDAQLRTKFESDTAEDIIGLRAFDNGKALYDAGFLRTLTADDIPELANVNDMNLSAYSAEDGTIYALPGNWTPVGFLYNTEIFEEYGIEEPVTWDDFFAACDTLAENNVTPIAGSLKETWVPVELITCNIGPNFYGAETWRKALLAGEDDFTNAGFVEMMDTILKMSEYFPRGYEALGYFEAQQYFASGQAAIIPEGSWAVPTILSENPDIKLGYFAPPVKSEGDTRYVGLSPALGYGINKNSANQEACLTFLQWLASPKGAQLQNKYLPGQFCAMPDAGTVDDELFNEWLESCGENGSNGSMFWCFEKLNAGQPGGEELAGEAIVSMLSGEMTAEEAANHIQEGVATWFEPFMK